MNALVSRTFQRGVARFWGQVDQRGPDECWLWLGFILDDGYGQIRVAGKKWGTHRFSYFLATGEDPGPLFVLHRCDERRCVNRAHLWLGTNTENIRDMVAKGRSHSQKKTHCDNGHPLFGDSVKLVPGITAATNRVCMTCRREKARARYHQTKSKAARCVPGADRIGGRNFIEGRRA